MKQNPQVSSSRSKSRKQHFQAPSHLRRVIMSAPLSKELRAQYGIRALPIHRDDTVQVARGSHKGKEGKVTAVYRLKYAVHVEKIATDKASGNSVPVNLASSNLVITSLKLDAHRKALISRKGGKAE